MFTKRILFETKPFHVFQLIMWLRSVRCPNRFKDYRVLIVDAQCGNHGGKGALLVVLLVIMSSLTPVLLLQNPFVRYLRSMSKRFCCNLLRRLWIIQKFSRHLACNVEVRGELVKILIPQEVSSISTKLRNELPDFLFGRFS